MIIICILEINFENNDNLILLMLVIVKMASSPSSESPPPVQKRTKNSDFDSEIPQKLVKTQSEFGLAISSDSRNPSGTNFICFLTSRQILFPFVLHFCKEKSKMAALESGLGCPGLLWAA